MDKPTCRQCEKRLRRYRFRKYHKGWGQAIVERYGGLAVHPGWGDYGDGYFCSLRCGFAFALQKIAVMERIQQDQREGKSG